MSASRTRKRPPMRIQNVFVFLLLAFFAVCAIFLTAMSARVYRDTVRSSDGNNTARIIDAILRGAAQNEDTGSVYVMEEGATAETDADGVTTRKAGIPVLVFRNDYDGEIYLRRLYCLNGWLWESFTAEEYGFEEEMGESLVAVRSFEPEVNGNLLTARIVTPEGQRENVSVYLWAGGAKE